MNPPVISPTSSIVPPRVGRALLIACWLAVVYGTAATVPHLASVRGVATWVSTFIFLGALSWLVVRRAAGPLVYVSGVAAVAMQFLAPSNGAFVAAVAGIAVAGIRLDARLGRIAAVGIGVGFLAASAASERPFSSVQIVSVVPALLFAYLGSSAMHRLQQEQRRTEELLKEVITGRDAVIRAAALDERAHLAREMHDVLAHTLSALSIQLEGARLLAEQQGNEPELVRALDRTSGLAREGLGEARRAVGSLRGETLPGPDLLPQLAAEFERDTGVPCRLQIEGVAMELPAEARLTLYRVAQEALTNVRKHADATRVEIELRFTPTGVELVVEDVGVTRASPLPGGGYGVSGMRERAERLDGKLEAASTAEGYRVRLWIPAQSRPQFAS